MISFQPTDDQKLMLESVGQFARTTIRPKFRESEANRGLSGDILRAASDLGLGMAAAELGLVTAVLLEEELAWADPGAAFALPGPGAFGFAVRALGTEEQAAAALAPFGDPTRIGAVAWGEAKANRERAGFTTTAMKTGDAWTLNGTKSYVLNADRAASFVVFAQSDAAKGWSGIDAFVVDATQVKVGDRVTTLGLDAASFGSITLDNVAVPESARLQKLDVHTICTFFAKNALVIAARAVGLSRGAFEATREYVDTRKAFGKPIGHFQAVAFNVADRAMDVDAARALVWRAAAAWDANDKDALLLSAQAIAFAHEAAMRCGDDGVQLHGGAGFMRDYAVEKFMRDAKQIGLCGMTAEHADQLAAALALGVPLDPALVLPTPDTQNVFV
jgi:acyl-CoA dehydrogenase